MSYIGTPPSNAFTSLLKQDFTTSVTTGYTLDHAVNNANDIALFINFVRQEPTAAYSASGTTLTLTSATASTDDMYCVYLGQALQTVNPPNNSVNEAQLNYPLTTFSSTGIDDNATTNALTIDSSSNLQFNSGFGSVTTVYGCRSWVNFNGTGTLAIRNSGNVSSVTDNGTGSYTVNFATNMPDVNYASVCSTGYVVSTGDQQFMFTSTAEDTHAVGTYNVSNRLVDNDAPTFAAADSTGVMVSIFR
jgi:hypothetical protein